MEQGGYKKMLYGTEDKIIGSDWKKQEKSDNSKKLDDLGEWENRKKYFIKRDDYIYQQTNGCDNFYNKWLIINDTLIKSDSEWLSKQSITKIDLDLAYKYMEELTNRFEPLLKKVELMQNWVSDLCHAIQQRDHPEYNYNKEDSKKITLEKTNFRVRHSFKWEGKITQNIIEKWCVEKEDKDFLKQLEEHGQFSKFLIPNLLYNGRIELRKANGYLKKVKEIITKFCEDENLKEIKEEKNLSVEVEEQLRKKAKKYAYKMIFSERTWNIETCIEILLSKIYEEIDTNKPVLKLLSTDNEEKKEQEKRRDWIKKESEKYFIEEGNGYTWRLTEKAVMKLSELEDKEKCLDLMNYAITINVSMCSELNWIISKSEARKSTLERMAGFVGGGGAITKLLKQKDVKTINPFMACLLWKASNISFTRLFEVKPVKITYQDEKLINVYLENKEEIIFQDLERFTQGFDTSLEFAKIIAKSDMEYVYGKDYEKEQRFWYSPMVDKKPLQVCIEICNTEKVKVMVEYSSFSIEPYFFDFPYSGPMQGILMMEQTKQEYIVKNSGFDNLLDYLKYCAEMMVRNFCDTTLAIPYSVFQEIKCFAKITVKILPFIIKTQDGKLQLEFALVYVKNNPKKRLITSINQEKDSIWDTLEDLKKDTERLKELIETSAIETYVKWNEKEQVFSDFTMNLPGFFEYVYMEPRFINESVYENRTLLKECLRLFT